MSETNLAITLALGIAGFFLGRYLSQLKQKGEYSLLKAQLDQEQNTGRRHHEDLLTLQREKEQVQEQLIRTQANNDHLTAKLSDQKKELEHIQERFTSEFENLAQKILDAKSEKFTKQNKESLNHVLKPLQEKIEQFEKRVESTHKDNIDYHASLRQQIIGLTQLNEQMSREATNLTKALKGDSKLQGN